MEFFSSRPEFFSNFFFETTEFCTFNFDPKSLYPLNWSWNLVFCKIDNFTECILRLMCSSI